MTNLPIQFFFIIFLFGPPRPQIDPKPDVDLNWRSSLYRELSIVSVQVRELVPGWGEGWAAENKDQVKFELIKIRLKGKSTKWQYLQQKIVLTKYINTLVFFLQKALLQRLLWHFCPLCWCINFFIQQLHTSWFSTLSSKLPHENSLVALV